MIRNIAYRIFIGIPIGFVITSLLIVALLKWVPVRYTPLMLKRAFQFREMESYHTEQEWVSLDCISPELIDAVIIAEDSRFYEHSGFDWRAIIEEMRSNEPDDRLPRGCSTITQQTAKNVFTLGTHTWIRKAFESWWTVLLEWIWGKERILEIYMNIAELGYGIYGVEAASKYYFNSPSSKIGKMDAAAIAVCLPSPLTDQPGNLTLTSRIRKGIIVERLESSRLELRLNNLKVI